MHHTLPGQGSRTEWPQLTGQDVALNPSAPWCAGSQLPQQGRLRVNAMLESYRANQPKPGTPPRKGRVAVHSASPASAHPLGSF